ncbi:hypothetical protein NL676_018258 [Syzygium grande]|nr:hypothetical protein NL676_018258 [Syzygium grande]
MASSGDGENGENRRTRLDRDEPGDPSQIDASSVECGPSSRVSRGAAEEIGMVERLTDVFVRGGDGDLLMQRSDREDRVLQALDVQVVGACRTDEILKPLLKSSGSSSAAKDRLLAHLSRNEIMMTVFPMFQQHIEPHLVHAHLKIRNDVDPVLSPESSLFLLKSDKQVAYQDILKILDHAKICSSAQNFTDICLRLPGIPANGQLQERDYIRVRICEGRFAVLIREPIREGNFIIQPKVDFDISVSAVASFLNLGYQAVAYIEASAFIYQDGKVIIADNLLFSFPCWVQ